jgi:dual specificity tyrosine-phosphorylation-regulated kinase 2/3/4
MWSFGCIVAELYTGKPLFPAVDENELIEMINIMIGYPDMNMITKSKKRFKFFDKDGNVIISKISRI